MPGPVFTNILLVDEINRATPRTQSALLEAMQERQVSVEGVTRPLPEPFLVLATQNPIEYEGTFSLPEAQLDRFLLRLGSAIPDRRRAAHRPRATASAEPLEAVATGRRRPTGSPACATRRAGRPRGRGASSDYLVAIVVATREHADIELGASPRASVALYRAAQAAAFIEGRDFVRPDDIRAIVPAVLGHRLRVDLDSSLHGATADRILADIVAGVPVPVDPAYDRAG